MYRLYLLRPALLSLRQILFLIGLTLIIGIQKTFVFFARRQKLKGTAAFMGGILLILIRWPLTGFLIELYGIFVLFGDFFATIASFAGNIPIVGPYIQMLLQKISSGRRNAGVERGTENGDPIRVSCLLSSDLPVTDRRISNSQ